MEQDHRAALPVGMDRQEGAIKAFKGRGRVGHGGAATRICYGQPLLLLMIRTLIITTRMSFETGYRLADNSRLLRRLFDERVRSLGLTAPQARLLLALERHPGENQALHAERLEIEPITLTRIVDRLEEAGWLERRSDPADRRARILHLTEKSRSIVERLRAIVATLFEDMLVGVDPAERLIFAALLERIGQNLARARHPEPISG